MKKVESRTENGDRKQVADCRPETGKSEKGSWNREMDTGLPTEVLDFWGVGWE